MRPALTVPQDAKGEISCGRRLPARRPWPTISVKDRVPTPPIRPPGWSRSASPAASICPSAASSATRSWSRRTASQEPATDVRWPGDFENQYVKWQAPVLTAKEAGGVQWLRADVGGRTVLLHTTTYVPGKFRVEPAINPDAPAEVVILSDQGPAVQFPVGAEFDDFRVEARYRDGYTRLVTKKAILTTPEPPPSAPLTASNGQPDRRASGPDFGRGRIRGRAHEEVPRT